MISINNILSRTSTFSRKALQPDNTYEGLKKIHLKGKEKQQ